MNREAIKRYLLDAKEINFENIFQRDFDLNLSSKIQAIIGARRTGKTYLLYDKIKKLEESGVEKERIIYLNFESPILDDVSYKDFKEIIELNWSLYPKIGDKKIYIFIDEPQVIPNWERAVRGLYDGLNAEIYITGSSSSLLKKEIATSLRGRSISNLLLPLSFAEYLRFKKIDIKKDLNSKEQSRVIYFFNQYLNDGGYPEIALEKNKKNKLKILKEYFDLTVFKDLVERYNIGNTKLVKILIDLIVASCSKEFSVNKHYLDLKSRGMKLGKSSLYEYFNNLEDSFFIFNLKKFSYSKKTENLSTPKVYLGDWGFLNLYFQENFGQRLENTVFLELIRETSDNLRQKINYWQSGGHEVDFVLSDGEKPKMAVQVTYSLYSLKTREREFQSLVACMKELKIKKGIVLVGNQNEETEKEIDGVKIKIIPVWRWLLKKVKI